MSLGYLVWRGACSALLAAALAACGGGDICFNCNPSGSPTPATGVTIEGNITFVDEGQIPGLTVLICSNESSVGDPSECAAPRHTTVDVNGDFLRTGVPAGFQQIFFSTEPAPQPGNLSAKLLDPTRVLDDVGDGYTADAVNVEITFLSDTAAADQIVVSANPTPSPTPRPTPTPSPTP